uniref:Coiled-coil domain containing 9B n=1 Tax=Lepisosteus oculatus TaxID=7918 RepID=W5N5E7_LEPOC
MHRPNNSPDVMFKKKEQKDAELDKKIEALRKKNEALMKRYQEVEEDKKRAEEEGMAFLSRRAKAEDLTITIKKSPNEARVVTKKPGSGSPLSLRKGQKEAAVGDNGQQKQETSSLHLNQGKRIVSEKMSQNRTTNPVGLKGFFEEEENKESAGTGRQIPFSKALDNKVKYNLCYTGNRVHLSTSYVCSESLHYATERTRLAERQGSHRMGHSSGNIRSQFQYCIQSIFLSYPKKKPREQCLNSQTIDGFGGTGILDLVGSVWPCSEDAVKYGPKAHADLDVLTFKEEQMEYIRWKKEREQIDRERVARHKNAKGQWRRAWDIDKTEN